MIMESAKAAEHPVEIGIVSFRQFIIGIRIKLVHTALWQAIERSEDRVFVNFSTQESIPGKNKICLENIDKKKEYIFLRVNFL